VEEIWKKRDKQNQKDIQNHPVFDTQKPNRRLQIGGPNVKPITLHITVQNNKKSSKHIYASIPTTKNFSTTIPTHTHHILGAFTMSMKIAYFVYRYRYGVCGFGIYTWQRK
jgi:hypothetical protein